MRSPLTAGSIARIQLVSHAHMTVSVHLTRLAHAGHADLGPEDRLVLPTWQHTARPHTDHPVRDAVNAGKPTVGCRSERRRCALRRGRTPVTQREARGLLRADHFAVSPGGDLVRRGCAACAVPSAQVGVLPEPADWPARGCCSRCSAQRAAPRWPAEWCTTSSHWRPCCARRHSRPADRESRAARR